MTHGRAGRDQTGRLHLAIHREAGKETLRLKAPLFEEDWQNQVAAGAANTARGVLGYHPTLGAVLALTRGAMNSLSQLVAGLLSLAPQGATVACRAGCDHCCHVVVGVTAPEALTIYHHLQRSLSAVALARLTSRIAEFLERTRGLSSSERFGPQNPCVFLDSGRCSIYEVRPLACRGMNSLDAKECESRLRDPVAREEFAANGGGRLFLEPIRAFHAVSAGLQVGLSELYHLDMRPLELTAALRILLEGGAPTARDWCTGRRPFDAAVLG